MKVALHIRKFRQNAIGDNGDSGSGLFFKSEKSKNKKGFKKGNNTTSGAGNGNDGSSKPASKTCYYCKELSHFRANCPVRKGKSQAAIGEEKPKKSYNLEEDLALVSFARSENLFDDWVLDSWFSFHMRPRRDWFDIYESCNGGTTIVGNNAPCKVLGIGLIRLRTVDGRRLTLNSVRHVPASGKNLIS